MPCEAGRIPEGRGEIRTLAMHVCSRGHRTGDGGRRALVQHDLRSQTSPVGLDHSPGALDHYLVQANTRCPDTRFLPWSETESEHDTAVFPLSLGNITSHNIVWTRARDAYHTIRVTMGLLAGVCFPMLVDATLLLVKPKATFLSINLPAALLRRFGRCKHWTLPRLTMMLELAAIYILIGRGV